MSSTVDITGIDRLISRVRAIANPDPTTLMINWMRVIERQNRDGVLAGLDKDGNPMAPVKYRPKAPAPSRKAFAIHKNNAKGRRGRFAGLGPAAAGLHNNLTPAEYRTLSGPPLAPRGAFSRVITNLLTGWEVTVPGSVWTAYGAWFEVVDTRGEPFLSAHFDGLNGLPRRDLRGIRPEAREEMRRAAIAWMTDQVRFAGLSGGGGPGRNVA